MWWLRDYSVVVMGLQCGDHVTAVWWSCDCSVVVLGLQCGGHVTTVWWSCDYSVVAYCTNYLSWIGEYDISLGARLAKYCTHECYHLKKYAIM